MGGSKLIGRIGCLFLAASLSVFGAPVHAASHAIVEGPVEPESEVEAVEAGDSGEDSFAEVAPAPAPAPAPVNAGPPPGYVMMNINTGSGTVEQLMYYPVPGDDPREEWTFLCTTPCRVSVHPESELRLRGGDARGDFEPIPGTENYVYYQPPNRGARAGGGVMIGLGGVGILSGFGMLFASLLTLPTDTQRAGGLALWSLFPLLGGVGLIGGGVALIITSRGRIRVGVEPVALIPKKLVLSPRGLHF